MKKKLSKKPQESYEKIPSYQFSGFYDEFWLNNNQKTNLRQYANELFGENHENLTKTAFLLKL